LSASQPCRGSVAPFGGFGHSCRTTIHGLTHRWLEECRPSGAPSEISRVVSRRVETRGSLPAARRGRLTEAACDGVVRGARRCREHALPGGTGHGTGCRLSLSLPGTGHIVSPRKPRRNRLGPFSGDREIGIGTGLMRGTGREHRDGIEDCPLTPDPSRRNWTRDAGLSRPTPRWDGTGHVVSLRNPRQNRPSRPRLLPSRNDPGQGLKSGTGHERRDWDGIDLDGTPRICVRTSRSPTSRPSPPARPSCPEIRLRGAPRAS
jgi:hypothetical protein